MNPAYIISSEGVEDKEISQSEEGSCFDTSENSLLCFDGNSVEGTDKKSCKKKKHKPANPYCPNGNRASMYVSKPRFFKNDMRRYFINMYVNVYHTWEENFTKAFFQSVFHPDTKYASVEYDVMSGQSTLIRSLNRAEEQADLWLGQMLYQPDSRYKISQCQLLLRSDGTSTIKAAFVLDGTKLVFKKHEKQEEQKQTKPEEEEDDEWIETILETFSELSDQDPEQDCTTQASESQTASRVSSTIMDSQESFAKKRTVQSRNAEYTSDGLVYNQHNPTESPNTYIMPFHFDGVLTFQLSADKLVTEVEFKYNWNKPLSDVGNVEPC